MTRSLAIVAGILLWTIGTVDVRPVGASQRVDVSELPPLAPTVHPPVSRAAAELWLAPTAADRRRATTKTFIALKNGIEAIKTGRHAEALRFLTGASALDQPLADYAVYHIALSHLELDNLGEADRQLRILRARNPHGYLAEATALAEATVAEEQKEYSDAARIYEELSRSKTAAPDEIWLRLSRAALAAGDRERSVQTLARVYYEFPFSASATEARRELDRLQALDPLARQNARYRLELGRAERLFAGRQYADAQSAFANLKGYAAGGDRDLIVLRLAECDFFRGRYKPARDALYDMIQVDVAQARQAEARYYYASALRNLGLVADFLRAARALTERFPNSVWAENALNDLASHYIKQDQDAAADSALRELYSKFPGGRHAERAAWKVGWRAYRAGRYQETIGYFEATARQFPRSDYRPSFLYWSGRAHEALGNLETAVARYTLATTDYLNTYYGRLASERLTRRRRPVALTSLQFTTVESDAAVINLSARPPTHETIRLLLSLELYDEALDEVRFAQRTWGDSPVLQATIAWIYIQQRDLRNAVVSIKRAYPQYMASGGELLPMELLKVIFPVDYWGEIRAEAARHKLSPYMLAALIAQESAFDAEIKSAANAVGLMQLLPSTGRRYARRLRLGPYRSSMLTTAKTNLAMGSALLADLIKKFGEPHLALAAYNAGDGRVVRWVAERTGQNLDREEFIDDIPFPETQAYVRKILSTAEDYRRLYADDSRTSH